MAIGIIGCDYSSKKVWLASLASQKGLLVDIVCSEISGLEGSELAIKDLGDKLSEMSHHHHTKVIYIEQPWGAYNWNTTIKLTRAATIVEVEAIHAGLTVKWAHPSSWRRGIFGKAIKVSKQVRKEQAVQLAEAKWGKKLGHDEAEAALIALYGWRKENESH